MFRKELAEALKDRALSPSEIAELFEMKVRDVEDALDHLAKSAKAQGMKLHVEPARCQKCDFVFKNERNKTPSRCPSCKSTWIDEPRFHIA